MEGTRQSLSHFLSQWLRAFWSRSGCMFLEDESRKAGRSAQAGTWLRDRSLFSCLPANDAQHHGVYSPSWVGDSETHLCSPSFMQVRVLDSSLVGSTLCSHAQTVQLFWARQWAPSTVNENSQRLPRGWSMRPQGAARGEELGLNVLHRNSWLILGEWQCLWDQIPLA